ncbi:hypothetical protein [Nostoc sp. CHAB 5836]|uniref:hypothetical protein n=1 Tax=Nostoc sp. CHAB 5836 TaxID=2780404 RepID=UPI001E5D8080|nr:hypothetical protein [Nostoc sp. CHAB 5836]
MAGSTAIALELGLRAFTNFGGLSQESLQAERFGSGSKSPSQNLITNYELF